MAATQTLTQKPTKPKPRKAAAKSKSKKNGHSANGATKAAKDYEVITLRIGKDDKAQLLAHCAKRAKAIGSQMSFNRAIIELIRGL